MAHPAPVRPVIRTVVDCPCGRADGLVERGLRVFRGLPYALPPVGPRRFRPAELIGRWTEAIDAGAFGPPSAQVYDQADSSWSDLTGVSGPARAWAGSENSLTLNVWAPENPGPHPVIVFIHGGANWLESSRLPLYSGEALARAGLVFVSFNYRLGLFGFLDLSPISGPEGAHSHGLTDQATALAWVAANIAAFGGDPDNVTLIGESAGSMDAGWLLAAGLLPKGVKRLVLMSGVASVVGLGWDGERSAHTPEEGARRAAMFLGELGVKRFADLEAAPTAHILEAHAALARPERILLDEDTRFYPRIGALAPRDPFAAAAAGAGSELDVIIGFTAYEMGLWLAWDDALDRRPPEWAAAAMPHLPSSARAALPALYRRWFPEERYGALGMHLLGDAMFALPSIWMADLLAASGARVFTYRFDYAPDPRRRALHASDLAFLFGRQGSSGLVPAASGPAERAERDRLSGAMIAAIAAFARKGNPATSALPWPRYNKEKRETLLLNLEPEVATDPLGARREWWSANVLPRALGGGA